MAKKIEHRVVSKERPFQKATTPNTAGKKRVAAYCRVSTLAEEQELSFESQKKYYESLLGSDPDKILVKVYGDDGVSGLQASMRPEFQEMVRECRKGNVDEVYTKSVSRFARNTVDALQFTRELKSIGVGVYFEKEKIDSANVTSEFLLTIFAAFAQEESHSISENTKRGIRNGFRLGHARYTRMLGYESGWKINTEQAKIVQRIFEISLDGVSSNGIAMALRLHACQ